MKKYVFIILLSCTCVVRSFGGDISHSVLATGKWYKFFVTEDGIYRITYSDLRKLGISNPAHVRIYGSGGAMLPEIADKNDLADLQEIPIMLAEDGESFLFYGQGPVVWKYDAGEQKFKHELHLYDTRSYYFITENAGGKRIPTETYSGNASQTVTGFDERMYHEEDLSNLIRSGRYWYGEHFTGFSPDYRFSFPIPDVDISSPVSLDVSFAVRSTTNAYMEVKHAGQQVARQLLSKISSLSSEQYAMEDLFSADFTAVSDHVSLSLTLDQNGNTAAEGWLNFIRLHARRKLNMPQSPLFFRDTRSVGVGQVAQFQISNASTNIRVWDITDLHDVKQMSTSLSGEQLNFIAATDRLREFVAFDFTKDFLSPRFTDKPQVDNQDLHHLSQVDMIIVSHPDFLDASQQLAALHHTKDGLSVSAVTDEQVYNEFSSGKRDPAAIRNFMKLVYEQSADRKFKYLLLMGDGSFENKPVQANQSANTNYMVTYQSENSLHTTRSFTSDDYFGILEDGETIMGNMEIGVGRLPVQTGEQARAMADKINHYAHTGLQSDWPNVTGFLADDEDHNEHVVQSDHLAQYVRDYHPQYTVNKLYFDAFPQVATVDGARYPEVEKQLNGLLNRGALLINYMGHGSETGLSEERTVNTKNINEWINKIYPLFVVATCEFGRYDDYSKITAGESVLLLPKSGGIAVLTTTRLVFSSLNYDMNDKFIKALFTRPPADTGYRLGDMLRTAKNSTGSSVNKLCFTLLGDPALTPPIPKNTIRTISINDVPVTDPLDTIRANSTVTIKASVNDQDDRVLTEFNGVVHIALFDKARQVLTLNNDGNTTPVTFETQTTVLYRGKASVKNGLFDVSFVMPRDINYRYDYGKITYFAYSDTEKASGAFTRVVVGGAEPPVDDITGPKIRLFMNDTLFRDGGVTNENPLLIAYFSDENGINISEEGFGHRITAVLNADPAIVYYLNPYYEADMDNHRKGAVKYQFSQLPPGDYEITLQAWDVANNMSEARLRFQVASSSSLQIKNIYNYPNPFSDYTHIYFEYNRPDEAVDATFQVFDLSGRMLYSRKQSLYSDGYTSGRFGWNGFDSHGNKMKQGIYICRIVLSAKTGQTVRATTKMLLLY